MTFVGVELCAGRPRLRLLGGILAPRLISLDATGAKVALVATKALLLGGDAVEVELQVGAGAWLEIVETTGTVAYDAAGEPSSWIVRATVDAAGLLLWHGEPLVVADGANTIRSSQFDLQENAISCVRETVVLGRAGELGGAVRIRNQVCRAGRPILVEDLDLRDGLRRRMPGMIGGATVLDTVALLGTQAPEPPPSAGTVFSLDGAAGTVARVLGAELAGSPALNWWSAASAAARASYLQRSRLTVAVNVRPTAQSVGAGERRPGPG